MVLRIPTSLDDEFSDYDGLYIQYTLLSLVHYFIVRIFKQLLPIYI